MQRTFVRNALNSSEPSESVQVMGWVRTRRDAKAFSFLEINDGSCLANLQVVVDESCDAFGAIQKYTTGSSIEVVGELVASQGSGQAWEIHAKSLTLIGGSDDSFPMQKKRHSLEYLREIAHLRPRSNLFGSVFRVRSRRPLRSHCRREN